MNPNRNNTPSSSASPAWWYQQNLNLTPVAPRFVMLLPNNNLSAIQYHLLNVTAPRPNYYPQLPINLSMASSASIVPDKYAQEVATVSSTPFQSTEEPEFVIGPAFSLANNHKDNLNLQTKDLSKAGPSNGHQASFLNNTITADMANQPFRGSVPPTLQSSNVPPPSVEPQICIGSVFSLADEHTGNTGQQERGRYANSFTATNSVGQKATGQECQAWASSAPIHYFPNTSGSYPKCSASQSNNPRLKNSVSPKQALENYISSTPTNSLTSRTISGSSNERMISSTVGTAAGTLLTSSYKQQDSNEATSKSNTVGSGAVNISGDISISSQDSQILPHAVAAKETEVVDLDTEDVDDCLLVKIDLRRHCMPFGIQIHNTEVVIHDSDTDNDNDGDDITGQTSEADDPTAPANIVSCSDNISVSTTAIGDGESPHTAACPTVDVSGNGTCELIGSLTMEVEEISSETDNLSKGFLEQTPVSSNSITNEILTSPLDIHESDIISSRCSVLDSETNPPDQCHIESDQVKTENNSFSTSDSDFELMELHVDEETPQSIHNECTNLKVITPSKFALADNNWPDLKPEPVCVSLITSTSSALSSNAMDPVISDVEDQDTRFEVTSQDQMTENHTNSITTENYTNSITDISSPFISTKSKATAKKRSKLPSIVELLTTPKTTSKKHIPGILMKSATKHSKKVCEHKRGFSTGISGAETQMGQNASSIMCKLCFLVFSSRMDLVTHTWNTHRHPLDQSKKCEFCDKTFASSSLLKLHQKINCAAFNGTRIVANTYIRKDSLLDRLFKESKGPSKITTSTRGADNSTDVLNELELDNVQSNITFSPDVEINSQSLLLNSCGNPNDSLLEHLSKVRKGTSTVKTSTRNTDNSTGVLWVDRTSGARGGFMDQEKLFQNEPKRNNHLNHIDVSLISSETDAISVPKSLFSNSKSLSTEPSIKDSHKECKKILVKLDQPSTCRFAALSDTESEQYDAQSNISFNPGVEINSESLLLKSGGNPNDGARIKCSSFPNQLQQDEHQRFSDGLKTSKNTHFKCFVCELVFTDSSSRFYHMWNTPRCFVGISKYCSTCSNRFQNPSDKQAHLSLSKLCGMNEMQFMKEVVLCKDNVHQDETEFRVSGLNQENRMVTVCRENINSNVYQKETEMRVSSLIHENVPLQTEDTFRIQPLQGTKETLLNENKRHQIPVEGDNNEKVLLAEVPENVNKEKMVHCMTCKAKFRSLGELLNHSIEKKCSATVSAVEDSPRSKELARVMPNPTSLVYKSPQTENTHRNTESNSGKGIKKKHAKKVQSCEIPTDISIAVESKSGNEIKKTHEKKIQSCEIPTGIVESNSGNEIQKKHAQKIQSCEIPTSICMDIKFNSIKEIKKTHAKKIRSCEIATGISSATHQVTLMCTHEGRMSVLEKPLDEENFVEKELNNMYVANLQSSDIPALNRKKKDRLSWVSLQPEVDVRIKGKLNEGNVSKSLNSETAVLANTSLIPDCARDEGSTDRNEEMFSDLSSTDCESDVDVDTSANEDGVEYKCRLCSKTFINQSLLNKHTKLHHHSPQRKNIQCKVCTRKFQDLTGLQAHLLQFRYCFIPLTRKLWERKEDTQICNMCRVSVSSSKDLCKHCFKSMACRLRYVKMVLKKFKRRDSSQISVLSSSQSTETLILPSEKQKEVSEINQGNSEVSSSVPDLPDSDNLSRLQTNHLNTTTNSSAIPAHLDCLNCGNAFSDFLGHLLLEQKCLDFYGIYSSKCPIPLPFCYKCKQFFDTMSMLTRHACPGFAPYTHTCSACGRKFTSGTNLNAHIQVCCKTLDVCKQSRNAQKGNLTLATNSHFRQQQGRLSTPKAGDVATTSKAVHSAAQSYSCLICDARFPLLRLLMQHSYQHEDETALKCERCDTTFVHYNQFVSHQAFHIRMDKENGILQTQLNELPPVLEKELPIVSNANSTKNQQDHTKSNNLFACLFCHQEFPNQISKAGHISNAPSCLGIMKYIVENKFFSINASDNQSCETKTNSCEFCHQICPNKISHYVQSGCINKLEQAILRFRDMSCHTEPMVPTGFKEAIDVGTISTTTKSNTPCIKAQSLCCPVCKIQFNDQNLLSSHQRKIHGESSDKKSPPESMTNDKVDEPDALYCFTCSNYLQTVKEVEQHKAVCKRPHVVLPISVAVHVDLSQELFRCKLCDTKYERERYLISHIIGKHYDKVINPLLVASGQAAVLCFLCSNNILLLKVHSHFAQHRKEFLEGLSKSLINAKNNDTAKCIFCNVFISRGLMQKHLKTHTVSCILAPGSHSGEKAALKTKSSEVIQTKVKEKKQKIETTVHKTKTSGYAVRCKICYRVLQCEEEFKFHFKDSHQNCGQGSWSQQFSLVKLLEAKPKKLIGASKCLVSANLADDNGDSYDRKSLTDGSMVRQCSDHESICFDSTNKTSSTSSGHKVAHSRPIGNCKICLRKFTNFLSFRFHLKTLHNRCDPEDAKTYFQAISPLDKISNFIKPKQVSTAGSRDNLRRVCLMCRASFSNASLYQKHLKTHLVQCTVVLHDRCVNEPVDAVSDEDTIDFDVKIEYD